MSRPNSVFADSHESAGLTQNVFVAAEGSGDLQSLDVVAIHGLAGGRESSWAEAEDPAACWLEKVFPQARVILYGYDTGQGTEAFYTRPGIIKEAHHLLDALNKLRTGDRGNKVGFVSNAQRYEPSLRSLNQPLVFVGHGVGGLLIKAALSLASRNRSQYGGLLYAVHGLIFFGYPHSPSGTDELRQQLFQHAVASECDQYFPGKLLPLTDNLAQIVTEVNHLFLHAKVLNQAHVINIRSSSTNSGFPKSTNLIRVPFERMIETTQSYLEMSRIDSDMIQNLKDICNNDWGAGKIKIHEAAVLRTLWSQASPLFPHADRHVLNSSTAPDSRLALAIKDFLVAEDDQVLHFEYEDDSIDMTSDIFSLLDSLESEQDNIHRYRIDPTDIRFRNMDVILRSILSSLGYHTMASNSWELDYMLSNISIVQAWTFEDLLEYWDEYITVDETGNHIYVFADLGKCDASFGSAERLISYLASFLRNREGRFRLIITTTANDNAEVSAALLNIPEWVYKKVRVTTASISHPSRTVPARELGLYLAQFQHVNPRFSEPAIRGKTLRIFEACGDDIDLRNIVSQWLQSDHRPLKHLSDDLDSLCPPQPETVFGMVLARMPDARQKWALTVLCWVLRSVRPLRTAEFCLVAHLSGKTGKTEDLQSILHWFGGILQTRNDEIHFGHRKVRAWLHPDTNKENRDWWHQHTESQGHLEVLSVCLTYLKTTPAPQVYSSWPEEHLFPYAVEYWVFHYRRARLDEEASLPKKHLVFDLLNDTSSRIRWIEAYNSLVGTFSPCYDSLNRSLPVAAYVGLDDQLEDLRSRDPETNFAALINAARQGHESSVSRILPWLPPLSVESSLLEPLLQGALSSGKSEVMKMIIEYMPKTREDTQSRVKWLSRALLTACWRGEEDLMERLMDLGADPEDTGHEESLLETAEEIDKDGPSSMPRASESPKQGLVQDIETNLLHLLKTAIRRDAIGAMTKLLDLNSTYLHNPEFIKKLGYWGTDEMIRVLFNSGFAPHTKDTYGRSVLEIACVWGRYTAVETLLTLYPYEKHEQAPKAKALLAAARRGHSRTVSTLLKHRVDANEMDEFRTSLEYAVSSGKVGLCRSLLEAGADAVFAAEGHIPPLIRAVRLPPEKMVDMVRLLLDFNADTEARDTFDFKRTPLLEAAFLIHDRGTEAVQLLLENGADADAIDTEGYTSLYLAAYRAPPRTVELLADRTSDLYTTCTLGSYNALHAAHLRPESARVLIKRGMDPTEKYKAVTSAIELAARWKPETLEIMLEGQAHQPESLGLALIGAVRGQHETSVRLLLDAGASVRITTDSCPGVLFPAMAGKSESIVRMVLEFNPDLEATGKDGEMILHWVTASTPLNSVKLAVNAGAHLDTMNHGRATPLMESVSCKNRAVVQYLLTKEVVRAGINNAGETGTALHRASGGGTLDFVKLLVECGGDPDFVSRGMAGTPLSAACLWGEPEEKDAIVHYLLVDKGASPTYPGSWCDIRPFNAVLLNGSAEMVRLFIDQGVDPRAYDPTSQYPVHLACYNSLSVIETLSLPDELFAVEDIFGRTPLHFAAVRGQMDLLSYVLKRLVDIAKARDESVELVEVVNTRDKDNWTALHWAARNSGIAKLRGPERQANNDEVVDFLLAQGADPCAEGHISSHDSGAVEFTWRPSDVAMYHGNSELAKKLRKAENLHTRPAATNSKARKVGEQNSRGSFCTACLCPLFGTSYICEMRDNFGLCIKCIRHGKDLHDSNHKLVRGGHEKEEEMEEAVEEDPADKRKLSDSDLDELSEDSRHIASGSVESEQETASDEE